MNEPEQLVDYEFAQREICMNDRTSGMYPYGSWEDSSLKEGEEGGGGQDQDGLDLTLSFGSSLKKLSSPNLD